LLLTLRDEFDKIELLFRRVTFLIMAQNLVWFEKKRFGCSNKVDEAMLLIKTITIRLCYGLKGIVKMY
jgi:hypothetical protein